MPLSRSSRERAPQIAIGVLGEVLQPDVAGLRVEHELGGDRRDIDLVAIDVTVDQAFDAAAA